MSVNFLHGRPGLYERLIPDHEQAMGRFLAALLARYGAGPRLLDVGCGLGREVAYLRAQGYDAWGLDESAAMVAWCEERQPEARWLQGDQRDFCCEATFDALSCVGSTFLYNLSNADCLATLATFARHVRPGGLLILEMRNGAFFLTPAGQEWLASEHYEEREGLACRSRFALNLAEQVLERHYTWELPGAAPLEEQLRHRLLFPQELRLLLEASGFEVLALFDEPAPHIGVLPTGDVELGTSMRGRRMHVVGRRVDDA